MAWTRNRESATETGDSRGPIGGFLRFANGEQQTSVGPIFSPNGTKYWITVDNAGALATTTTDPNPI